MPDTKAQYRLFAQQQTIPIFLEPWWLDAVCQDTLQWNVAIATNAAGEIAAAWPYVRKRRYGIPLVLIPPFTLVQAPVFHPGVAAAEYLPVLKKQLPLVPYFVQRLPFDKDLSFNTSLLPHSKETRQAHILDTRPNLEPKDNYRRDVKRRLKQVQDTHRVRTGKNADQLFALLEETFLLQDAKVPVTKDWMERWVQAILQQKRGLVLEVYNPNDEPEAAGLVVWDHQYVYSLIANRSRNAAPGAFQLLLHEAIQVAVQQQKTFHFGGSMMPRIAEINEAFGAIPYPYQLIRRKWL